MHEIFDTSAEAVKIVVPELLKRGYQLVTIGELNQYIQATLLARHTYSNMYKQIILKTALMKRSRL